MGDLIAELDELFADAPLSCDQTDALAMAVDLLEPLLATTLFASDAFGRILTVYPVSKSVPESWVKAEQVWCSKDRNEALTLAKLDEDFDSRQCDSSVVSSHYSMGQDVGLRGTPAIVLEDGTLFSGYLPPKQLSEAIASALGE